MSVRNHLLVHGGVCNVCVRPTMLYNVKLGPQIIQIFSACNVMVRRCYIWSWVSKPGVCILLDLLVKFCLVRQLSCILAISISLGTSNALTTCPLSWEWHCQERRVGHDCRFYFFYWILVSNLPWNCHRISHDKWHGFAMLWWLQHNIYTLFNS